jgi:hypothetical protein
MIALVCEGALYIADPIHLSNVSAKPIVFQVSANWIWNISFGFSCFSSGAIEGDGVLDPFRPTFSR